MPKKKKITKQEILQIEKAVRREIWIEAGCPISKTGISIDQKKERNKRKCREPISAEEKE